MKRTILTILSIICTLSIWAVADTKESKETNETTESKEIVMKRDVNEIISSINDTVSNKTIVNVCPSIVKVLNRSFSTAISSQGFRLQIFSSNRGPAARQKAFSIENYIKKEDPNVSVYVTYEAPFWKVRLGNCTDKDEANLFRKYIIDKFPDYAGETYIVPSKIESN